jgi:hypothetical protein
MIMKKDNNILWLGLAAAGVYFFYIKPKQTAAATTSATAIAPLNAANLPASPTPVATTSNNLLTTGLTALNNIVNTLAAPKPAPVLTSVAVNTTPLPIVSDTTLLSTGNMIPYQYSSGITSNTYLKNSLISGLMIDELEK